MPSTQTDPAKIQIQLADDGTASLHGINYQDLRSILTAASLYNSEQKPKVRPLSGEMDSVVHANNVAGAAWYLWQNALIDILSAHMAEAIRPGYSDGKPQAERTLRQYKRDLTTLDAEVREAEQAMVSVPAPSPLPDPLAEISLELAAAVRAADTALAKLEHVRNQLRP